MRLFVGRTSCKLKVLQFKTADLGWGRHSAFLTVYLGFCEANPNVLITQLVRRDLVRILVDPIKINWVRLCVPRLTRFICATNRAA